MHIAVMRGSVSQGRGTARCHGIRLLVLLFLVGSFLPAGTMPVARADGLTLVLCSVDGPRSVVIDPATGQPVDAPADTAAHGCGWAALQGAALAAPAAFVLQPLVVAASRTDASVAARRPLPPYRAPPRATGPPVLS